MTGPSGGTYLPSGLPRPARSPDAVDAPYWDGARSHRLLVQVCGSCGTARWPPEEICSVCHSFEWQWLESSGAATIVSWTRVWHPVHPALQGHGPNVVVVVELDDFPVTMVGNLLGDPSQDVEIGEHVDVEFEDHLEDDFTLVQWRRRLAT
jgi:uncharacterized OB-fold protein